MVRVRYDRAHALYSASTCFPHHSLDILEESGHKKHCNIHIELTE